MGAESGTLPSAPLGFPHISCYVIGSQQAWGVNDPDSAYLREGIAKLDAVILGLNTNLFPSIIDGSKFLSRQTIVNDLKSRNPDLQIFDYIILMETTPTSGGSLKSDKLYDLDGPPGAEIFWRTFSGDTPPTGPFASTGLPVNDTWARRGSGEKVGTFGNSKNTNICPAFTIPDSDGKRYPQWLFDNVFDPLQLEPHLVSNGGSGVGPGGIGIFIDNFFPQPRRDSIDFNGDGRNDESRDVWDAFSSTDRNHVETVTHGGGLVSAGEWRQGHTDLVNFIKAKYPDCQVIVNATDLAGQDEGTGSQVDRNVQPEYQLVHGTSVPFVSNTPKQILIEGGILERQVDTENTFPVTGVNANGTLNGETFPGPTRGWRLAYNAYRWIQQVSTGYKRSMMQFTVNATTRISPDLQSEARWDWVPDSSASHSVMRWGLCTALLDNGSFMCNPIQVGTTKTGTFSHVVIFDEFGTINNLAEAGPALLGVSTGLRRGWLGQPKEGPVNTPFAGSGDHALYKREFEGGLAIVNSSKQNALNVAVADLPGGSGTWKRITGVQNTTTNDGTTINSDFVLSPIDGVLLERV